MQRLYHVEFYSLCLHFWEIEYYCIIHGYIHDAQCSRAGQSVTHFGRRINRAYSELTFMDYGGPFRVTAACDPGGIDFMLSCPVAFTGEILATYIVGAKPVKSNVMFKNEVLDIVEPSLFLGFTSDAKLRWNPHLEKA
ncbi:hypothetical protein EVAR_94062_1 [Eumeta japonica]|uniref:Uncharacterized protein n=1 Tax=Eumeta variegata TaxID=151549 RepID=A0A4C1V5Z8_EUMVA|nr:hypothetical protein EVAR_94062_1 [Eumeta japonica]